MSRTTPAADAPTQDQLADDDAAFAAIEFEPIAENIEEAFGAKKWAAESRAAGVSLRVAAVLVKQTKAKLIDNTARLIADDGGEAYWEIVKDLQSRRERFELHVELLRAAALRLMVAGKCAIAREEAKPGA